MANVVVHIDRTGALYLLMLWLTVLWCGFPSCLGTISITVTGAGVKGSWQSERQHGHVSLPLGETVVTELCRDALSPMFARIGGFIRV